MGDKTVILTKVPELPAGHRPTRVYTVLVGAAGRDPSTTDFVAYAVVRERYRGRVMGHGGSYEIARRDAAERAVRGVYDALSHDVNCNNVVAIDAMPNVRIDVVYE